MTDDLDTATTILCFMVKSIKGHYRDVVSLFPVNSLTADKLKQCFDETKQNAPLARKFCVLMALN